MRLVTYNINGIRAAVKKGLFEWIAQSKYDIYCFQETKAVQEQIDLSPIFDLGYQAYWHSAEKRGYSGVLTLSKAASKAVYYGMGKAYDAYDREGRVLRTDFKDFILLNCYFPSGSAKEERHEFKMKFLRDFYPFVQNLFKENKSIVVVGDYNIVHLDIDIHNPQRKDNPSGFRPEERRWLNQWFEQDFTDAYRKIHGAERDIYSWWSYRAGSRQRNKGWRIDYISISKNLEDKIISANYLTQIKHSDHCPCLVELKLNC